MKTLIYTVLGLVLLAHRALSAPSEREYNYRTARLEPTTAGQGVETWDKGDTQPFQRGGGSLKTSDSDVHRRQILTSIDVDPHTVRIKSFIMTVDP